MRIHFLLLDRFSNLCLANCLEPMRAANEFVARPFYEWQFLSPFGGPIASSSGLPVVTQSAATFDHDCDRLFVLTSYGYLDHDTANLRSLLWRMARKAKTIIGLDTAPWLMAAAGLLDQRKATLHWDVFDAFGERFLQVEAQRSHWIKDGPFVTCAGAHVSYDLTRDLIAQDLGQAVTIDMDHLFLRNRPEVQHGPRSQDLATSLVQRSLALMHEHVERPLPLSQIARRVACPLKTLTRRFQEELGISPGQAYRHLRLTKAHQLLINTNLQVAQVALLSGYENPAAMSRAFKARFECSPRDIRKMALRTAG